MTRLALALCAVVVIAAAPVALARETLPDHFQRRDFHRHAINAVIGDVSYFAKYGMFPTAATDADERVRTHLEFVYVLLSGRDVSMLSAELRAARAKNLENLRAYIDAGRFPRNYLYAGENHPCFIDRDGRVCAVGYLVEVSAGRKIAERINRDYQSEFLWRIRLPLLDRWVAASGLSFFELSMIQPCYQPEFIVQLVQDSNRTPATLFITGYVYDDCGCRNKVVTFDFGEGEGELWTTGEVNAYVVPIDAKHTYTRPGVYTITGVAVGAGECDGMTGSKTWQVTFTTPSFTLVAVQAPNGPPYDVYLSTTDDIRLDYLTAATVNWGDGGPPLAAGWYWDSGMLRTATYAYAYGGHRSVVVTHSYGSAPYAFSETSELDLDVGNATPVESSTWGRIKALYAMPSD
jgi:hypothetical protein